MAKDNNLVDNGSRINTDYVASLTELTPILDSLWMHSHNEPSSHADVAELADAQVSEACDGDIVEVQVLSSAPLTTL